MIKALVLVTFHNYSSSLSHHVTRAKPHETANQKKRNISCPWCGGRLQGQSRLGSAMSQERRSSKMVWFDHIDIEHLVFSISTRKQREMMIYVDYETQQCIWRFCSDHEIVCVAAQLKNYMHDADFIIIEDPTLNPLLSEIEFGEEVERRLERIDNLKEYEETVNRRRNHNK
eukprot:184582_1